MEGLALGFMADRFDIVPVRAQTRRTIVFATRLHSRAIESFDLLAILGRERQVKTRRLLLGLESALTQKLLSNYNSARRGFTRSYADTRESNCKQILREVAANPLPDEEQNHT